MGDIRDQLSDSSATRIGKILSERYGRPATNEEIRLYLTGDDQTALEVWNFGMPRQQQSRREREMIGEEEIERRFGNHTARIEGPNATAKIHADIRHEFRMFALWLDRVLPAGREKSVAFTELENASMWSHKALAQLDPVDPIVPSKGPAEVRPTLASDHIPGLY